MSYNFYNLIISYNDMHYKFGNFLISKLNLTIKNYKITSQKYKLVKILVLKMRLYNCLYSPVVLPKKCTDKNFKTKRSTQNLKSALTNSIILFKNFQFKCFLHQCSIILKLKCVFNKINKYIYLKDIFIGFWVFFVIIRTYINFFEDKKIIY